MSANLYPIARVFRFLVWSVIALLVAQPATSDEAAGVRKWSAEKVSGELREGGYVLVLQHVAAGEPEGVDCDGTPVLSPREETLAITIGHEFRRIGIPVARLEASARCVARRTAELLGLGAVLVDPDLNPVAEEATDADEVARIRRMVQTPVPEGANVLFVSHRANVNRLLKTHADWPPGTLHAFRATNDQVIYVGMIDGFAWGSVD